MLYSVLYKNLVIQLLVYRIPLTIIIIIIILPWKYELLLFITVGKTRDLCIKAKVLKLKKKKSIAINTINCLL